MQTTVKHGPKQLVIYVGFGDSAVEIGLFPWKWVRHTKRTQLARKKPRLAAETAYPEAHAPYAEVYAVLVEHALRVEQLANLKRLPAELRVANIRELAKLLPDAARKRIEEALAGLGKGATEPETLPGFTEPEHPPQTNTAFGS